MYERSTTTVQADTDTPARVYRDGRRHSERHACVARFLLPLVAVVAACVSAPITGRSQFIAFDVQEDTALGEQAYDEMLAQEKVVTSGPQVKMVERVMQRLAQAATRRGLDNGFDWEVRVLDAPNVPNAWALPGGKMAVYTGILPITQDEAGLAVVMGHEFAHAVARHGAERVSHQLAQQGLLQGTQIFKPDWGEYAELGMVGFEYLWSRPWGRKQESEADRIGLELMAEAGYDPRAAIDFWQRMSTMSGGGGGLEWLSTHPSHGTRIEQIQAWLPEVMPIYEGS